MNNKKEKITLLTIDGSSELFIFKGNDFLAKCGNADEAEPIARDIFDALDDYEIECEYFGDLGGLIPKLKLNEILHDGWS